MLLDLVTERLEVRLSALGYALAELITGPPPSGSGFCGSIV